VAFECNVPMAARESASSGDAFQRSKVGAIRSNSSRSRTVGTELMAPFAGLVQLLELGQIAEAHR
jgi:hypothetical protein